MKTRRILSVLLVAVMLVPLFVMGISAETTQPETKPLTLENLGWSTDCPYGTPYVTLSVAEGHNGSGDNALKADTSITEWGSQFEILSAAAMAGVRKYTVSMDAEFTYAADFSFILNGVNGDGHASYGDWIGYNWYDGDPSFAGSIFQNRFFDGHNGWTADYADSCAKWILSGNNKGTLTVVVDLDAKTVSATYNFEDPAKEDFSSTRATLATAARVTLMLRGVKDCYIDNLKVVDNTQGANTVIYNETFESFTNVATDNTGKSAGEVIFYRDFDGADAIHEDWGFNGNATLGIATGSSNPFNNSAALTVTGEWKYVDLVPGQALASYDVYTVYLNAKITGDYDGTSRFVLLHNIQTPGGGGESNNGWAELRGIGKTSGTPAYNNFYYGKADNGGQKSATATGKVGAAGTKWVNLALTINKTAKTATLYHDGVEISTCPITTIVNDSPISLIVQKLGTTYIDEIVVTAGTFADAVPAKAVKDYSGKKAGEVFYNQSFNEEDLYVDNVIGVDPGKFNNTHVHQDFSGKINGTPALFFSSCWGARELVDASVLQGYDVYTLHMDVHLLKTGRYFGLMWDCNSTYSTGESTYWSPLNWSGGNNGGAKDGTITNKGITSGADMLNRTVAFALEIDHINSKATVYYDGQVAAEIAYEAGKLEKTDILLFLGQDGMDLLIDNLKLTAGTYADYEKASAQYVGYQTNNDGDIRFVGMLGSAALGNLDNIDDVGFTVKATYADVEDRDLSKVCTYVYNKLTGTLASGTQITTLTYTPDEFGGSYLFALTVTGIPADIGTVTFEVTPFYTVGEEVVNGTTWVITYDSATGTATQAPKA